MKTIILKPLEGMEISDLGEVAFGQTIEQVKERLGEPSLIYGNQLFYDELELRIDCDEQGLVEFIECIYGPFCEKTIPMLYGERAFELLADELVALLTEKNSGKVDDREAEYGYYFKEISVGVYREATPKDALESIAEVKAEGMYEEERDWLEEDLQKSQHFWSIGIGVQSYYSS